MEHDADFEREKWRVEVELRQRELSLKEREQANRDAELDLNRKDRAGSKWRNPLVVAIFAAAVAALGNAGVTLVNGMLQRELDNAKRDAELRIEESKAEASRILEMIKTGNTESATKNLTFLLDTGLVPDSTRAAKLRAYLISRTAPVLPAGSVAMPGPLNPFKIMDGRDMDGHSLQPILGSDLYTCASECNRNSQCVGFTFGRPDQVCYLMDAVTSARVDPISTSGVKNSLEFPNLSTAPIKILRRSNVRIIDKPYDVKAADNFATCRQLCVDDLGCIGFNFLKNSRPTTCEMFSSVLTIIKEGTADSGIKRQEPPEN